MATTGRLASRARRLQNRICSTVFVLLRRVNLDCPELLTMLVPSTPRIRLVVRLGGIIEQSLCSISPVLLILIWRLLLLRLFHLVDFWLEGRRHLVVEFLQIGGLPPRVKMILSLQTEILQLSIDLIHLTIGQTEGLAIYQSFDHP